ncbi:MAG: TerB family tellurite resistance protein [Acidobacteriota bacterium]
MSLLRFLGLQPRESENQAISAETESVRKITRKLDALDPENARYIAAFAYILSRVAHADMKITEDEAREMERIVMETGRLTEEQAIIVVQIAKTQNKLFGGTEDFLVTREFNKIAGRDQKLSLLNCLFALSSTDETISMVEDRVIRQIARELNLEHRDFIATRSAYREHLSVFKKKS